jgi:hypothetical protein
VRDPTLCDHESVFVADGARALTRRAEAATLGALGLALDSRLATGAVDRIAASGLIDRFADRLVADGTVERTVDRVFDDERVLDEVVTRLLASEDLWLLVDEIARSPSVTEAITQQSVGFADQVAGGVRQRSRHADARLERAARALLRRPQRT